MILNNKIPYCVASSVKNKNSHQEIISTNCAHIFMSAKVAFIMTTTFVSVYALSLRPEGAENISLGLQVSDLCLKTKIS